MDKRHLPQPLKDLAAQLATDSKGLYAWMEELTKASRRGNLRITKKDGKRGARKHSTEYDIERYLEKTYLQAR